MSKINDLQKSVKKHYQFAFSLTELLITIAVAAILLLVTIPKMTDFLQKNRAEAKITELTLALEFARSEAIKRGENITFCPSPDNKNCGTNWNDGQIVTDAGGGVLRVFEKVPSGDHLTWQSSLTDDKSNYVIFLPTGATYAQQGSFYYCPNNNSDYALAVIVHETGFIRVSNKDSDGGAIKCDFSD
jgi:type IV fimbrial biogenesis protein FimT